MKSRTARLAEQIEELLDTWKAGGGRLPAVRALSARLNTSPVTLLRILNELAERRILQKDPVSGRYYVEGCLPERRHATDEFIPRHVRIATQIRDEILRGRYGRARALPSVKQLQSALGCAKKTALQAYALLQKQGLLSTTGRKKLVNHPGRSAQVVLAGTPSLMLPHYGQYHPIIDSIEQELAAIGWGQLQLYLAHNPNEGTSPRDHEVAGYIFLHVGTQGEPWRDYFARRPDIRCVTLDPSQEAARIRVHRHYYRISVDNTQVGREAGRYAMVRGHRRAVFIAHLDPSQHRWLSLRWKGVEQEFSENGGRARLCLPNDPDVEQAQVKKVREEMHELNGFIGHLQTRKFPRVPDIYQTEILRRSHEFRDLNVLAARLTPLFAELLKSDATIWICGNDHVALLAHRFLASRKIRIGQEVSVAGFDNLPFTHTLGVSSYHFPYAEMGSLAVHCLENPRHLGFDKANLLQVSGRVIGRQSVGTCRP